MNDIISGNIATRRHSNGSQLMERKHCCLVRLEQDESCLSSGRSAQKMKTGFIKTKRDKPMNHRFMNQI